MHMHIQTMSPDQAARVIQNAWRDYVYENPDRPTDYDGMSQVNIEY